MDKNALQSLCDELRLHVARRARTGVRWAYPNEFSPDSIARFDAVPSEEIATPRVSEPEHTSGLPVVETLDEIRAGLGDCTRCKLHAKRKNIVFGVGSPTARLMLVGEGPGEDEDVQGEPFVGKAGQLLTRILEAIGLSREDVYIANVVKCRPPGNRNPEPDEIAECMPFLERQIASVRPAILVGLGNVAVKSLLGVDTGIMRMRGAWRDYRGIPFMPTLHPSYVLRTPEDGRPKIWEDFRKVAERYNQDLPPGVKPCVIKSRKDGS